MQQQRERTGAKTAAIAFGVFDPIAYGALCAALFFDVLYAQTAEILWVKSAAWLIVLGLVCAVIPRFINLIHVWFPGDRLRMRDEVIGFWLNFGAIVLAIVNAFVHSRDAYGVMPEGEWLSVATVFLLVLARVLPGMFAWNERSSA